MYLNNIRPRRNRKNHAMRSLMRETTLTVDDLIMPLFVIDGQNQTVPVTSMPGINRYSRDLIVREVKELWNLGIKCVSLFPALDDSIKDRFATESKNPNGLLQQTIKDIKNACPDMLIMTDVAMDPYSSDGHDGLVCEKTGEILNDETLDILAAMALAQAQAGSDIIGPSDMMDGRIAVIREALDSDSFTNTQIMSYTAKYASAFYGPFRDALDSAPKAGDKKTYQMDPANTIEALREIELDEAEGADILMVKPGISYLDIIAKMKERTNLPVAAYNVSGEYAMVKAAAQNGWVDGDAVAMEMLTSFKRAGCDMILTYFAKEVAVQFAKN
ncbi:porphobilinogen synthase [Halobacteriovorax sp. HFRX-2_2]|uniref:porphobilinogen synthase n=1 Tax=unclassified Halobacteriovorax TaxID=2639665 RepID=UPI003713F9E5